MAAVTCLTVAASDSGGGAGIAADLKAFAAAGCHGALAITAVTAQDRDGIQRVDSLPPAAVRAQIDSVVSEVAAVKTGALINAAIVDVVAEALSQLCLPLVVDPVMAATAGGSLLDDSGKHALLQRLLPLATVITPNLDEASLLVGKQGSKRGLAEALHSRGARAVVITGGHGSAIDHLFDGVRHVEIAVNRLPGNAVHGTGCTHSATLAALLALGEPLESAARGAAAAAERAVAQGTERAGGGEGPVDVLGVEAIRRQVGGESQRLRTR